VFEIKKRERIKYAVIMRSCHRQQLLIYKKFFPYFKFVNNRWNAHCTYRNTSRTVSVKKIIIAKVCFSRICSSIVDRFTCTSNHDDNDQRSIIHRSSNIFHQRKCLVSV